MHADTLGRGSRSTTNTLGAADQSELVEPTTLNSALSQAYLADCERRERQIDAALLGADDTMLSAMLNRIVSAIGERSDLDLNICDLPSSLSRWRSGLIQVTRACDRALNTPPMRRYIASLAASPIALDRVAA